VAGNRHGPTCASPCHDRYSNTRILL